MLHNVWRYTVNLGIGPDDRLTLLLMLFEQPQPRPEALQDPSVVLRRGALEAEAQLRLQALSQELPRVLGKVPCQWQLRPPGVPRVHAPAEGGHHHPEVGIQPGGQVQRLPGTDVRV